MLLEIVTRHLATRPNLLRRNQASLVAQDSTDWIQTILADSVGRGIPWTHVRFRSFQPMGDYVWVLDDDDECIMPGFVSGLAAIVEKHHPSAIMVRMDHGSELGILPDDDHWGCRLQESEVGSSAIVASRNAWLNHRHAWGERYAGDYDFIRSVQEHEELYWWDVVASKISKRHLGAGE